MICEFCETTSPSNVRPSVVTLFVGKRTSWFTIILLALTVSSNVNVKISEVRLRVKL